MLRFLGLLTLVFLIYRWVVRPLLITPQSRTDNQRANMADWMQQQFRAYQDQQKPPQKGNQRTTPTQHTPKSEEEYIDYEEVD